MMGLAGSLGFETFHEAIQQAILRKLTPPYTAKVACASSLMRELAWNNQTALKFHQIFVPDRAANLERIKCVVSKCTQLQSISETAEIRIVEQSTSLLSSLNSLKCLDLFSVPDDLTFQYNTNLEELSLCNYWAPNRIPSVTCLTSIACLKTLHTLDLNFNNLTFSDFEEILPQLPNLHTLMFPNLELADLEKICQLKSIKFLNWDPKRTGKFDTDEKLVEFVLAAVDVISQQDTSLQILLEQGFTFWSWIFLKTGIWNQDSLLETIAAASARLTRCPTLDINAVDLSGYSVLHRMLQQIAGIFPVLVQSSPFVKLFQLGASANVPLPILPPFAKYMRFYRLSKLEQDGSVEFAQKPVTPLVFALMSGAPYTIVKLIFDNTVNPNDGYVPLLLTPVLSNTPAFVLSNVNKLLESNWGEYQPFQRLDLERGLVLTNTLVELIRAGLPIRFDKEKQLPFQGAFMEEAILQQDYETGNTIFHSLFSGVEPALPATGDDLLIRALLGSVRDSWILNKKGEYPLDLFLEIDSVYFPEFGLTPERFWRLREERAASLNPRTFHPGICNILGSEIVGLHDFLKDLVQDAMVRDPVNGFDSLLQKINAEVHPKTLQEINALRIKSV